MKRFQKFIPLISSMLLLGCSNPLSSDITSSNTEIPQIESSVSYGTLTDEVKSSPFLGYLPDTKIFVPKTSTSAYSLEYITYPKLSDESVNYTTKAFQELEGLFKDNIWSPIYFIDNDSILLSAIKLDEQEEKLYRYNLKTKDLKKLYQDPKNSRIPDLFITNSSKFGIGYDNTFIFINNDRFVKEIQLESLQERYKKNNISQISINPITEKGILLDYLQKKSYLTDLVTGQIEELPFQGVYRALWIDNYNLLLGTFDKIDNSRHFEGSAIITYNIRSKTSSKTYLGEKMVFGNSYRSSDNYYGFNFLIDYTGPPHGTIGVINNEKKRIMFLELEKAVDNLSLRNNWIVTAIADTDKPVNWEVWCRTTEDKVLLCVYDVASETYIIRAKDLPKPSKFVTNQSMIISPDGKTIIYLATDKAYINQVK